MKKHSIPGKMNQNLRTIVKGFSISIAIILLANTRGGNLEIDASDYRYSDINTDPRYPLQNKTCELLITIHNKSDKPIEDIKLTTSIIDKQTIDTRNVRLDSNTSETVRIPWTPDDNGWYRIQARAVSEKHDSEAAATRSIPVLARQFYFSWYVRNWEEDRLLRWVNLVQFIGKGDYSAEESYDYWRGRGAFVYPGLGWRGAKTPEQFSEYLADKSKPYGGLIYDEVLGYSNDKMREDAKVQGIKLFTEQHPESFTAVYIGGSLKPVLCNLSRRDTYDHFDEQAPDKTGVDLLLLECYNNYQIAGFNSRHPYAYLDQRIRVARDYDVLEHSLMILGYAGVEDPDRESSGRGPYWVTKPKLEDQVRYVRQNAPSMPGIGFYGHPNSKDVIDWNEMITFADSLCLKYFINPVITAYDHDIHLSPTTPEAGEEVTIKAEIHNIGGMDAENVDVTFYDGAPQKGGEKIGDSIKIDAVPADESVPPGRYTIEQPWTPTSGHHTIYLSLTSDNDKVTVLNSLVKRQVTVRE